jgi:hypothetical protein
MSALTNSQKYGEMWVYAPLSCVTGALHQQPHTPDIRIEACTDFANGYDVMFDVRGSLDATNKIPRGGVRAEDFAAGNGCLLIGHVYRAGWHS